MKPSQVFDFENYKEFLAAKIRENKATVGYKSQISRAMKSPPSFLSQVLHGSVHLSGDHAYRLAQFWNLAANERDYFLDLVQLARAGTPDYRSHLKQRLDLLRKKSLDLSERFQQPKIGQIENEWFYYSNWYFGAIHMLLTIPGFQRSLKISERLHIPVELVNEILNSLKSAGLAENKSDQWQVTQKSIHLNKESVVSSMNHILWRQRAIHSLEQPWKNGFHYSGLHTLSQKDMERVRSVLTQTIEEVREVVEPSPEEKLAVFNCDWFEI
jgi:uncharacterized protein (TIGR02147 family)